MVHKIKVPSLSEYLSMTQTEKEEWDRISKQIEPINTRSNADFMIYNDSVSAMAARMVVR